MQPFTNNNTTYTVKVSHKDSQNREYNDGSCDKSFSRQIDAMLYANRIWNCIRQNKNDVLSIAGLISKTVTVYLSDPADDKLTISHQFIETLD